MRPSAKNYAPKATMLSANSVVRDSTQTAFSSCSGGSTKVGLTTATSRGGGVCSETEKYDDNRINEFYTIMNKLKC